jgi:hypothetical protein
MTIVRSEIPETVSQVTNDERKATLRALDELPEPEIDYSDIPEATDISDWMTSQELAVYLAKQKQTDPV